MIDLKAESRLKDAQAQIGIAIKEATRHGAMSIIRQLSQAHANIEAAIFYQKESGGK
jgi:hypothetical protein